MQGTKGQYYHLTAIGVPNRCRKEQIFILKGPFIRDEKITPELEQDIISTLKSKMIGSMKTVKTAKITKNPASIDNGIMSHMLFSGQTIWSSEVTQ